MLTTIGPHVLTWSEIHGAARGEPYPWNGTVICAEAQGALALVDPLALSESDAQAIERIARPTHVLLTCEYHWREAESCRRRRGCQILANARERDRYAAPLDGTFRDGERLWGLVDPVFIRDTSYPETAFLVHERGGVLIIGDVLSGGRKDHGIPEGDVGIVGPQYFRDLAATRRALADLLDLEFETLCFGHGSPVRFAAKSALRRFVENDVEWARLERRRRELGYQGAS